MMQAPGSLDRPAENDAPVSFCRNRIFIGDGVTYNVGDGEKLVGEVRELVVPESNAGARVALLPITKEEPEDFAKSAARLRELNPTMVKPEKGEALR